MRLLFWFAFLFIGCLSQPMGFGQGGQEKKAPIRKSDLPFIACQTCQALVQHAFVSIKSLRKASKPGKPIRESDIYGFLENVCDPDTDEGEWLNTIDLVETGSELKLSKTDSIGFCETKCRTLARACTDLIEEFDYALSEALFSNDEKEDDLVKRFCTKVSTVCARKPPKLPKDRPKGAPFIPMTEDDYKMKKMMQQMKAMGLGGQVFDQDSAREYIEDRYGDRDRDEDDEEEDIDMRSTTPSSNTNTVLQFITPVVEKIQEGYEIVQDTVQKLYKRVTSRTDSKKPEL